MLVTPYGHVNQIFGNSPKNGNLLCRFDLWEESVARKWRAIVAGKRAEARESSHSHGEDSRAEQTRNTAAIQVDKDIAQMVRTIASHDGTSQAAVVRGVLRPYVLSQMARVRAEIDENLKRQKGQG